jgi:uncharacterized membrane protein
MNMDEEFMKDLKEEDKKIIRDIAERGPGNIPLAISSSVHYRLKHSVEKLNGSVDDFKEVVKEQIKRINSLEKVNSRLGWIVLILTFVQAVSAGFYIAEFFSK